MAVIKQTRQFTTGNIGVVRSSNAGEKSAVNTMKVADDIINMAFTHASNEAGRKGAEIASSLAESNIRTINPDTGMPEALASTPETFGTVATNAYRDVIDARYRGSIDREIKQKAADLALVADQQSDPISYYSENFGDYLDKMTENSTGMYSNYVKETGTAYLASTKLNLQERMIARDREQAGVDITSMITDNLPVIQELITSGAEQVEIDLAMSQMTGLLRKGQSSRSLTPAQVEVIQNAINGVKPRAMAQIIAAKEIPQSDLLKIFSAIQSNGQDGLNDVPKEHRAAVQELLDTYNPATDSENVLATLNAKVALNNRIAEQEQKEITEANIKAYPEIREAIQQETATLSQAIRLAAGNGDLSGIEAVMGQHDALKKRLTEQVRNQEITGTDMDRALETIRMSGVKSVINSVIKSGIDEAEIRNVSNWLESYGEIKKGISQETLKKLQLLIDKGLYKPEDNQLATRFISSYQANQASFEADERADDANELRINNNIKAFEWKNEQSKLSTGLSLTSSGGNLDEALANARRLSDKYETLVGTEDTFLSGSVAAEQNILNQRSVAEGWVKSLSEDGRTFTVEVNGESVQIPMTSDIMVAVAGALKTNGEQMIGVPPEIQEDVKKLIGSVDKSAFKSAEIVANSIANKLSSREAAIKTAQENARVAGEVAKGTGGNTKQHKNAVDQTVFGNNGVGSMFFRSPTSVKVDPATKRNHPATKSLLEMATKGRRLPESFVQDLSGIANGAFINGASSVIQHYKSFRFHVDPQTGQENNLFATAILGPTLSKEDQARLDSVISIMSIRGEVNSDGTYNQQALATTLAEVNSSLADTTTAKLNIEQFLTATENDNLEEYMYNATGGNVEMVRDMTPYLKVMISTGRHRPEEIHTRIKDYYDSNYPETQGFVVDMSLKTQGRSRYALNRVAGTEDKKMSFLNDLESRLPSGFTIIGTAVDDRPQESTADEMYMDTLLPRSVSLLFNWLQEPYSYTGETTSTGLKKVYLVPETMGSSVNPTYRLMQIVNRELRPVLDADGNVMKETVH